MWMKIVDKDNEYIINADCYKFIKESFSCHNEFQIIFYGNDGDDLILSYLTEQERDDMYNNISQFIQDTQGRRPW